MSIKTLNVKISLAQKVTLNKKPPVINKQFVIKEAFSLIIVCLELAPLWTCAHLLQGKTFLCPWFHMHAD